MKLIEEMDRYELGKLFPILLTDYRSEWADLYLIEKTRIQSILDVTDIVRISHIGSTTLPKIVAKPTIDILLEIRGDMDTEKFIQKMESIGFLYSPKPQNPAPHIMFMKGYTPKGFEGQAFHVHVRYPGDWDELYFRDYLLSHEEVAKEYAALKIQLKEAYPFDREAYTEGKTTFIQSITEKARKEIGPKYVLSSPVFSCR